VFDADQCADLRRVVEIMSCASVTEALSSNLGHPEWVAYFLSEKLQNVMAVTDVLPLFWQTEYQWRGEIAMKKIALILALAFAFTTGMALTTAFAFGLIPLLLTWPCVVSKRD
jgi:hypothetical protein